MSFGGPRVDEWCTTLRHPSVSLLTGLIANAFGWERQQCDRLTALQARLVVASRIDHAGHLMTDYQTVSMDLVPGHHFYKKEKPPHIRRRTYLSDAVVTLAVGLVGTDEPDLTDCELALRFPARPLFYGRASCFPSQPFVRGISDAADPLTALAAWPRHPRSPTGPLEALVRDTAGTTPLPGDRRDWANGVGVGVTMARLVPVNPVSAPQHLEVAHV